MLEYKTNRTLLFVNVAGVLSTAWYSQFWAKIVGQFESRSWVRQTAVGCSPQSVTIQTCHRAANSVVSLPSGWSACHLGPRWTSTSTRHRRIHVSAQHQWHVTSDGHRRTFIEHCWQVCVFSLRDTTVHSHVHSLGPNPKQFFGENYSYQSKMCVKLQLSSPNSFQYMRRFQIYTRGRCASTRLWKCLGFYWSYQLRFVRVDY